MDFSVTISWAIAMILPTFFRTGNGHGSPGYLNRRITPILQSLSQRACTHPIHTIVCVALLASTTYVGLLEGSLSDAASSSNNLSSKVEFTSLVEGARHLKLGEQTGWKWQSVTPSRDDADSVGFHIRVPFHGSGLQTGRLLTTLP